MFTNFYGLRIFNRLEAGLRVKVRMENDSVLEREEEENVWIFRRKRAAYESFRREYEAKEGDVVVASVPKAGSNWTRSLVHSIMACAHSAPNLLGHNHSRDVVPLAEIHDPAKWRDMPSPRHLATHLPYHALPHPLRDSNVKIVYVTRNPRDTCVSLWKFRDRLAETTAIGFPGGVRLEEFLDTYCAGMFLGGPFVENVLGYYEAAKKNPDKVLFVRYEDMKANCEEWVRKIGDFLGYRSDIIHPNAAHIAELCSFERQANASINRVDTSVDGYKPPTSAYFREGKAGGWKEHFTPEMLGRIRVEIEDKLDKKGLRFNY